TKQSITEHYLYNQTSSVPDLIMDSNYAYLYLNSIAPYEQINLTTGEVTYLIGDANGSIRGVMNQNGSLKASVSYDAYGNPTTKGGLSSYTPFGFAGSYMDPTGLYYMINRYYDPSSGQFISVDPLSSITNQPYAYTGGDPVNGVDPMGLQGIPSYCYMMSGVSCRPTSAQFLWYYAEQFVATMNGVENKRTYFSTPCGARLVDVYSSTAEKIIEVKTGYQSANKRNLTELAKDKYLLDTGGNMAHPVSSAVWYFFPGVVRTQPPSRPLVQALVDAGITVNVYYYEPPPEPDFPQDPDTEPLGNPGELPPADSNSGESELEPGDGEELPSEPPPDFPPELPVEAAGGDDILDILVGLIFL
ncbi:MAG: RHS repeat-associated core domain-containing protein, partial [Firmicutes bacterium]|nr:RHS repeat-associated core domain-containing protein [Bacillota bacterium]